MPRRIFLDRHCETFCYVDDMDFDYLSKWKWSFTWDRDRKKKYATRMTRKNGKQIKIYMHKDILANRMEDEQPSEAHTIGDHGDGDSLNNCRYNLSWATPSMNARTARRRRRRLAA